ncbi:MAG: 4Fe-4S binding protein [bacterium]|nr:4Fe-4S binding protein [bacterium]
MRLSLKPKAIFLRRSSQIVFLLIFTALFLSARDPLLTSIPTDLLLRIDPLAALIAMLSSRLLLTTFWPAIITIILSILLGRSFCGWVCPLGTTIDVTDRIIPKFKPRGASHWKYAVLIGLVITAIAGIQIIWLLDPLVIFTRTLTLTIYPLVGWGLGGILNLGLAWDPASGFANWIWGWFEGWLLPLKPFQTALLTTTLVFFAGILILEKFGRRYWCRVLCPLGALLGIISRYSPFGRKVSTECSACALCAQECRMGAIEPDFLSTRRAECILCLECSELCPAEATTYNWYFQEKGQAALNIGRRRALWVVGSSLLAAGAWRTGLMDRTATGYCIRPPGALREDEFLDTCLRCQECVKACSSTGGCLQPSALELGWGAIWTPRAHMREGYCEYSCTLCGQVCPSGALQKLTVADKKQKVIGLAYFDHSRCIPWATGDDCIVCEEHCPTSPKAIQFRKGTVDLAQEIRTGVKLPYVDTAKCIGCGICEYKCPIKGESAIRITNEGEQRTVKPRLLSL